MLRMLGQSIRLSSMMLAYLSESDMSSSLCCNPTSDNHIFTIILLLYTFLAPEVLLLSSDPRNLRHNSNPGSNLQEPHFRIGGNQQFVGVHLICHAMASQEDPLIHFQPSLVFGPRTLGMRPSRLAMAFHSMASRGTSSVVGERCMFSTWCRNE